MELIGGFAGSFSHPIGPTIACFRAVVIWRYSQDPTYSILRAHNFGRLVTFIFKYVLHYGIQTTGYYVGMGRHSPEEIFKLAKEDCQV